MNTTHTLTRDGAQWELYRGAPYADHRMASFSEPKAKNALEVATRLIGATVEWRQLTPSEYRA